jgi:crotonobetainyl-CoA:carnitine CoA-transferase CaiB-like acyl-CoA transferase
MVDISMLDMAVAWQAHAIAANIWWAAKSRNGKAGRLNGGSFYDYMKRKTAVISPSPAWNPNSGRALCRHRPPRPDRARPGPVARNQQAVKAEIAAEIGQTAVCPMDSRICPPDVCVEPVLTIPKCWRIPRFRRVGMVVDVPKPAAAYSGRSPTRSSFRRGEVEYRGTGTAVGAHTAEVLQQP